MKIEKHNDEYYEKIVTWEKEPDFFGIFLSLILIGWCFGGMIIFRENTFVIITMAFFIYLGMWAFIYSLIYSLGSGKKVKYKRLK